MANIMDYIAFRGDLSFSERPFNDADSLIMTELAYLSMENITPGIDSDGSIRLEDFCAAYLDAGIDQSYLVNDPKRLLVACAGSERFRDVRFKASVHIIDDEIDMQFDAVTFVMDDAPLYVAFGGTDNSIAGWKEDCNFSYQRETPGQRKAAEYLDRILEKEPQAEDVRCGGHSKGGNLAVYAAAFCKSPLKSKITHIYSHDGPGFNREVSTQPQYREMLPKVELTIPETSLVGILMSNTKHRTIVKSDGKGPIQHDPYTWQITRDGFDTVSEQSDSGVFLNTALNRWVDSMDPEERKEFVTTVFELLEASGASTTTEINANKLESLNAILSAAKNMDKERRKAVWDVLMDLAAASRDTFWDEKVNSFRSRLGKGSAEKTDNRSEDQEFY